MMLSVGKFKNDELVGKCANVANDKVVLIQGYDEELDMFLVAMQGTWRGHYMKRSEFKSIRNPYNK